MAAQGTPAWKAIVDAAEDYGASLIVLGSHSRAGLGGRWPSTWPVPSPPHSRRPVLISLARSSVCGRGSPDGSMSC
jgi:hypothetical protein